MTDTPPIMVDEMLSFLERDQCADPDSHLFGNYPSTRYHALFPISRQEDNVYFVAWVNQVLRRNLPQCAKEESQRIERLIDRGDVAIAQYRNRYGDITYNFYRPKAWFPNGKLLSRYGLFQPTDDADDTCIAFRGRTHDVNEATRIKEILHHQSN
ncbi:MAG: hypothetical protein HKN79_08625, partial [Flavobacteriales bacterium]|nr:hypothetical protein [Flavobacteriales bacterium]